MPALAPSSAPDLKQHPARPKRRDPACIAAVAEKLAPEVLKWMNGEPDDLPGITKDLAAALRWDSDGYALAQKLDDYSPDAELVEILDQAGSLLLSEHTKACQAWVQQNNLQGPLIGTKVLHERGGAELGVVTQNWPDGRSTVAFAGQGHVTSGAGCHGYILEWETLTMPATPEQQQ